MTLIFGECQFVFKRRNLLQKTQDFKKWNIIRNKWVPNLNHQFFPWTCAKNRILFCQHELWANFELNVNKSPSPFPSPGTNPKPSSTSSFPHWRRVFQSLSGPTIEGLLLVPLWLPNEPRWTRCDQCTLEKHIGMHILPIDNWKESNWPTGGVMRISGNGFHENAI